MPDSPKTEIHIRGGNKTKHTYLKSSLQTEQAIKTALNPFQSPRLNLGIYSELQNRKIQIKTFCYIAFHVLKFGINRKVKKDAQIIELKSDTFGVVYFILRGHRIPQGRISFMCEAVTIYCKYTVCCRMGLN